MPVHPESPHYRARSFDADPLRYLRGALVFFLGGGTLVALVLALTGVAPRALLLAGLLWALFGLLTAVIDFVMDPLAELIGRLFANVSSSGLPPGDRIGNALHRAQELAGPLNQPALAVKELLAARRSAGKLAPATDLKVGLALAELYEHHLDDPGRALAELSGLLLRHPELRETVQLREVIARIRAQHLAELPRRAS